MNKSNYHITRCMCEWDGIWEKETDQEWEAMAWNETRNVTDAFIEIIYINTNSTPTTVAN